MLFFSFKARQANLHFENMAFRTKTANDAIKMESMKQEILALRTENEDLIASLSEYVEKEGQSKTFEPQQEDFSAQANFRRTCMFLSYVYDADVCSPELHQRRNELK